MGSQAESEIAASEAELGDPQWTKLAFSIARGAITVAGDHVVGSARTLAAPVPRFTHWLSIRGVLESAGVAAWMSEEFVDHKVRAARALSWALRDLADQQRFLELAKGSHSELDEHWDAELPAVVAKQEAIRAFVAAHGMALPPASFTSISLAVAFADTVDYPLYSGVAHGRAWALNSVAYILEEDAGVLYMHQVSNAAIWYSHAAWSYARVMGGEQPRLEHVLESEFERLGLSSEAHFWKGSTC